MSSDVSNYSSAHLRKAIQNCVFELNDSTSCVGSSSGSWLDQDVAYIIVSQAHRESLESKVPPSGYRTSEFKKIPPGPAKKSTQAAMSESEPGRPLE